MDQKSITKVKWDNHIIQVKLLNVEKNSLFVGDIFQKISQQGVNIDMISQVMLENEMRIDLTCHQDDQELLNQAIEQIKKDHPRVMIYQSRNVSKIKVENKSMAEEIGFAAKFFDILGRQQIPMLQITTSETSISCVIPRQYIHLAITEIKKEYHIEEERK